MSFLFINKTLWFDNLKTRIAMNAKISVLVICVEAIIYLLLFNLYDFTFKSFRDAGMGAREWSKGLFRFLSNIYDRTFARIANGWKTSTMSTKISVTVVWYGSQNIFSEAQFSARYFNIKIRSCRVGSTFYSQIQGETKVINVWKKCLKL